MMMMMRIPFVITAAAVVLVNTLACAALAVVPAPASGGLPHQVVPVKQVFVITHAAGRMGKLLALQIKEDAEIEGRLIPTIRAVVRSEAEAMSVKCDLGGMSLAGGTATPNPLDWLETIVVGADVGSEELGSELRAAFEGATYACLCDASHNELVAKEDGSGYSINVPAAENRDLSARLLAEIDAAARSTTLRHTLLRSSMGLASPPDGAGGRAMGGEVALDGARQAEARAARALERYTVLRLGALTDDPGMVPLVFGQDDAILRKRLDGSRRGRPPIVSRADAARASAFLMKEPRSFDRMVIDCAWHPKYGRSSVGTEEAKFFAARQDLKREILSRCDVGGGVTTI